MKEFLLILYLNRWLKSPSWSVLQSTPSVEFTVSILIEPIFQIACLISKKYKLNTKLPEFELYVLLMKRALWCTVRGLSLYSERNICAPGVGFGRSDRTPPTHLQWYYRRASPKQASQMRSYIYFIECRTFIE